MATACRHGSEGAEPGPIVLRPTLRDPSANRIRRDGLFNSRDAAAVCQLEGDKPRDMTLTVRERGWVPVAVETPGREHFPIFAATAAHQGNLVGDVRGWTPDVLFFVKPADEQSSAPRANVFAPPDGREI